MTLGEIVRTDDQYNTRQAIEAIRQELPQTEEIAQIIQFVESSRRGIIR